MLEITINTIKPLQRQKVRTVSIAVITLKSLICDTKLKSKEIKVICYHIKADYNETEDTHLPHSRNGKRLLAHCSLFI